MCLNLMIRQSGKRSATPTDGVRKHTGMCWRPYLRSGDRGRNSEVQQFNAGPMAKIRGEILHVGSCRTSRISSRAASCWSSTNWRVVAIRARNHQNLTKKTRNAPQIQPQHVLVDAQIAVPRVSVAPCLPFFLCLPPLQAQKRRALCSGQKQETPDVPPHKHTGSSLREQPRNYPWIRQKARCP